MWPTGPARWAQGNGWSQTSDPERIAGFKEQRWLRGSKTPRGLAAVSDGENCMPLLHHLTIDRVRHGKAIDELVAQHLERDDTIDMQISR